MWRVSDQNSEIKFNVESQMIFVFAYVKAAGVQHWIDGTHHNSPQAAITIREVHWKTILKSDHT